jgi:hypothetical protein
VLVALGLNQRIENLALGVDGTPQIDHLPIDLQIDFVKMSGRMWFRAALAEMRGDHRPEMVHPASDGLVRDRDPTLRQQILDVAKAQREPEIEPNRLMDDLRREPISSVPDFPHTLGYSANLHPTSSRRRDKAIQGVEIASSTPRRLGSERPAIDDGKKKDRREAVSLSIQEA